MYPPLSCCGGTHAQSRMHRRDILARDLRRVRHQPEAPFVVTYRIRPRSLLGCALCRESRVAHGLPCMCTIQHGRLREVVRKRHCVRIRALAEKSLEHFGDLPVQSYLASGAELSRERLLHQRVREAVAADGPEILYHATGEGFL